MIRLLLALSAVALALLPAAHAAPPDCRVPAELIQDDPRLPALAERLRDKRPVTIVAIGGASTAGAASANPAEDSYPSRLQAALRRRYPGVPVTVVNKGVPRQTTQQMVDRFARDVLPLSPDLVIWETGTLEAARGLDIDLFAGALDTGLADLREHRIEVMLMDMQYSRGTASVIYFGPYIDVLQRTADADDVYVFHRFDVMRYWAENGVFDFVDVPKEKRGQFVRDVYGCLAERLAEAIGYATRPAE